MVAFELDGYGVHLRSLKAFEHDRFRGNELTIADGRAELLDPAIVTSSEDRASTKCDAPSSAGPRWIDRCQAGKPTAVCSAADDRAQWCCERTDHRHRGTDESGGKNVRGEAYASGQRYSNAIEQAGGVPLMLPPIPALLDLRLDELLTRIDGVLFHGGGDVNPELYGQQATAEQLYGIVPEHDLSSWA